MALPAARITRRQLTRPASRAALPSASSLTASSTRPASCAWPAPASEGLIGGPAQTEVAIARRAEVVDRPGDGASGRWHERELQLPFRRQVPGPDEQAHVKKEDDIE